MPQFCNMGYLLYLYSYLMLDQCEINNASCYGVLTKYHTDGCCPTCQDVKTAYQNMEWYLAPHNVIQCSGKFISFQLVNYITVPLIVHLYLYVNIYIGQKATNHMNSLR